MGFAELCVGVRGNRVWIVIVCSVGCRRAASGRPVVSNPYVPLLIPSLGITVYNARIGYPELSSEVQLKGLLSQYD